MAQAEKRAGFKRAELADIIRWFDAHGVTTAGLYAYNDTISDASVAKYILTRFERTVAPEDVVKLRKSLGIKFASEGQSVKERLDILTRAHTELTRKHRELHKRVEALEALEAAPLPSVAREQQPYPARPVNVSPKVEATAQKDSNR